MIQREEVVRVGYFTKPHGIKGELSLVTDYDLFEDESDSFLICEMDGILVPFYVESFRFKSNSVILVKLENVNDETSTKRFVNQEVFCPANRIKTPLNEDFTWKRFTGYVLEDKLQGVLGVITDVDETTINTLFRVDYRGKELLVPIADELVVSVDGKQRKLVVSLPDGIIECSRFRVQGSRKPKH